MWLPVVNPLQTLIHPIQSDNGEEEQGSAACSLHCLEKNVSLPKHFSSYKLVRGRGRWSQNWLIGTCWLADCGVFHVDSRVIESVILFFTYYFSKFFWLPKNLCCFKSVVPNIHTHT
jgi:hypothetical protein